MKIFLASLGLFSLVVSLPLLSSNEHKFTVKNDVVSFKRDVRPVVKNRCMQCHNAKSNLPDITDYDVAAGLGPEIKKKMLTREMPYFGGMTESERDLIILWVDQGVNE